MKFIIWIGLVTFACFVLYRCDNTFNRCDRTAVLNQLNEVFYTQLINEIMPYLLERNDAFERVYLYKTAGKCIANTQQEDLNMLQLSMCVQQQENTRKQEKIIFNQMLLKLENINQQDQLTENDQIYQSVLMGQHKFKIKKNYEPLVQQLDLFFEKKDLQLRKLLKDEPDLAKRLLKKQKFMIESGFEYKREAINILKTKLPFNTRTAETLESWSFFKQNEVRQCVIQIKLPNTKKAYLYFDSIQNGDSQTRRIWWSVALDHVQIGSKKYKSKEIAPAVLAQLTEEKSEK